MTVGEKTARLHIRPDRKSDELRKLQDRYDLALKGSRDGIWDWDLQTGEVEFSSRWKSALGFEDQEIGSLPDEWLDRIHPEDRPRVRADLQAHLDGNASHFQNEHRILHKDGTYRWMLARGVALRNDDGLAIRIAGSQSDITPLRVADPLTGLPDRLLFIDRLSQAADRLKRSPGHLFAVLFLDLDHFKLINDRLGHAIGDQLLIEFARRIERELRSSDGVSRFTEGQPIARLGGDEFTILLDDLHSASDALRVAQRILDLMKQPFNIEAHELFINVSIGVALSSTGYERPEDLLRDADVAMYRAKSGRRGRVELFDAKMRASAVARLRLEVELQDAARKEQFCNWYQLIVDLDAGDPRGFEALVRWDHPYRGHITPDEFIPIAEQTGVIVPLGRLVLKHACREAREWQLIHPETPPLVVSVNLSCRQLMQGDLTREIREELEAANIPASCLKLEITESTVMANPEQAKATLRELKDLGVRIGMDDFGTGYSSLSYLHSFPLDTLKIDRSFISQIQSDADKLEIVSSIISLAHNLGLFVTAEGIETAEQMFILRQLQCDSGQGYLFSKPVNAADARELLQARPAWRPNGLLTPAAQIELLEEFHKLRRGRGRRPKHS
jgi:diguanylate cyclase (GGDEF)-like protein/PAS domain S-box-containing protein